MVHFGVAMNSTSYQGCRCSGRGHPRSRSNCSGDRGRSKSSLRATAFGGHDGPHTEDLLSPDHSPGGGLCRSATIGEGALHRGMQVTPSFGLLRCRTLQDHRVIMKLLSYIIVCILFLYRYSTATLIEMVMFVSHSAIHLHFTGLADRSSCCVRLCGS